MKKYKKMSLFHKILILTIFSSSVFAIFLFTSSLYIQNNLLIKNIIRHSTEIGETWSLMLDSNAVYVGLSDYNPNSNSNKKLIDQLTFLTENNDNIAQAYLFEAKIMDANYTKTLAQPNNILQKGVKLGNMQEQPEEWIQAAKLLLKTKQSTHTEMYSDILGTWITTLHPVVHDGEIIAIFAIDMDASIVKKGQTELFYTLLFLFFFFIIIIFIFVFLTLKKTFHPLNQVINGINEVSMGNFDVIVPNTDESEELKNLTHNFNFMVTEIKELFNRVIATSEWVDNKIQDNHKYGQIENLNNEESYPYNLREALLKINEIKDKTHLIDTLHYAEKINGIAQLAAVFAHEVRNPMTTVLGFLKFYSSEESFTIQKVPLNLMISEIETVLDTLNKYIEYAQPELSHYQFIDIKYLLRSTISMFSTSCDEIRFKLSCNETVCILCNPIELKQVFINLIQNAIESMKGSGFLSINISQDQDYFQIEIIDTGEGMTQDEINRLGTPFYSTKVKGTGVGLTKVFFVISKMKGKIKVKSIKGQGTNFTILLPKTEH
jgi:two-component system, sporulation sensor kinase B